MVAIGPLKPKVGVQISNPQPYVASAYEPNKQSGQNVGRSADIHIAGQSNWLKHRPLTPKFMVQVHVWQPVHIGHYKHNTDPFTAIFLLIEENIIQLLLVCFWAMKTLDEENKQQVLEPSILLQFLWVQFYGAVVKSGLRQRSAKSRFRWFKSTRRLQFQGV